MTRNEFIESLTSSVVSYINAPEIAGPNPQIRVNPLKLDVALINGTDFLNDIAYSDEIIEAAAAADRPADADADDYQVAQNPDFYPAATLVKFSSDGVRHPNTEAIERIADIYFPPK